VCVCDIKLKDGKHTADCLKKAVRIATQCMDKAVQLQLFVEILNSYVFFLEKGNDQVWCFLFFPTVIYSVNSDRMFVYCVAGFSNDSCHDIHKVR